MGDISSPQASPTQMAEQQADKITTSGPDSSNQKSASTAAAFRRHPPTTRQSSYGQTGTPFPEQFDGRNVASPPISESGPFNMAPMASALPHGGYQHPPPPGGLRHYNQQTSPPVMQHMQHNPYASHHPGSMMLPAYYFQQPQMHQYYPASGPPGHHGSHPMQGRSSSGYYPVPFVMDHPQSPGYYPQPPQFPDLGRQRPDYMMNRQNSQGHVAHEGRNPPRRPPHRTNKSFRDQTIPSGTLQYVFGDVYTDAKRQQQNMVRGPPRKPHQSGHAIWIGNLPPQTQLMDLVHHVCELAPALQSLFLISKSNCAFANFKEDVTSVEAQKAIHESRFQSVRLVCRLRKNTSEVAPESLIVIAAGTSNPASPTLASDSPEDIKSPTSEKLDPLESCAVRIDRKDGNGNVHRDRFFVLKSLTREDLEQSVRTSIWATQSHNEKLLNNAFQTTDNVYLVFSANKSGEYFGFARMTSEINQDPGAAIEFAPQNQTPDESDLPQAVTTEAKDGIPKGRIIDDSARGTMFWEIEGHENEGDFEDETDVPSNKEGEEADEDMQRRGKPFNLQWLSIAPLPFYRTRGLRNPWNSNREVKIARDGTELEPSVGRRLIGLMSYGSDPGQPSRFQNDPRGVATVPRNNTHSNKMAAFFPRTIYNSEASFTPLFRLLDDFDSYSRQCQSPSSTKNNQCKKQQQQQQQHFRKSTAVSHWQPKFDVRETADTYELHGELPGLNKNDVSIEFTEPQTLVVRGKAETEPAASSTHKATVADEDDVSIQEESGFEVVSEASNTAPATPETEAATVAATPADKSKYWLSERSIGDFARSFSFPARVDQDAVSAGFQDGILSISVPKAKKHETIRIAIN
ncbi:hypothetical protein LLEC1_02292 [Akanthomyces lecanii]|uniref:SHSP domain-containing protein n=1 Tax=Cordyceps confragosa TaxID=2714763 RepID=A0A179IAG5_CORDF|nr:hypothetical protein LLEC1_02292 [Akanthomyces lecanii]